MQFQVMSKENIIKYTQSNNEDKSIVISINDINDVDSFIVQNDINKIYKIHYTFFNDVESGRIAISEDQANEIAEFVLTYKDEIDLIIVHCGAGVSRSAGCCAAIMKALCGTDNMIFNNIYYKPNMKVYREVLKALIQKIGV